MPSRLERYEAKYRLLAAELSRLGFISQGSVVVRETSCGKQGCRCRPTRHDARALLPVEPSSEGQDREPTAHRERGRALPIVDRQPATPRGDRR